MDEQTPHLVSFIKLLWVGGLVYLGTRIQRSKTPECSLLKHYFHKAINEISTRAFKPMLGIITPEETK
jgi:hypothetical protein